MNTIVMRQMALAALLTLLAALMSPPLQAHAAGGNKVKWLSYSDAQKRKSDTDRKFFIYFHADWCAYCHQLDRNTFSDAEVADYINANFTPVLIDTDKEKKLATRFSVQGLPDLRFLDRDGKGIARWPGFIESAPLLNLLRFIHTDSYETMNFREFVKRQGKK